MSNTDQRELGHGLVEGVRLGVFEMNDPTSTDPGYRMTDKFWRTMRRNIKQQNDPMQSIILSIVEMAGKKMIEESKLRAVATAVDSMIKRYAAEGLK